MCGAFSSPVLNVFDQQGARLSRLLLITALKTEVYSEETSEGRPSFHTLGNLLSVNRVQVIYSLHWSHATLCMLAVRQNTCLHFLHNLWIIRKSGPAAVWLRWCWNNNMLRIKSVPYTIIHKKKKMVPAELCKACSCSQLSVLLCTAVF